MVGRAGANFGICGCIVKKERGFICHENWCWKNGYAGADERAENNRVHVCATTIQHGYAVNNVEYEDYG